jgi:hypothetical protein
VGVNREGSLVCTFSFSFFGPSWDGFLLSCREELSIVKRTGKAYESVWGRVLDAVGGMLDGFDM